MFETLKLPFHILSLWGSVFAALNILFFGGILVSAFLTQPFIPPQGYSGGWFVLPQEGFVLFAVGLFLFNFAVAALLMITLPGLGFFALPVALLGYRAFLWGLLVNQLSGSLFYAAWPTIFLEGEGYVVAAVAGIDLGLSWLKPSWAHKREVNSRFEGLKMALMECGHLYILVAILLFAAAIVESATIYLV
jgi:hypothetical protein